MVIRNKPIHSLLLIAVLVLSGSCRLDYQDTVIADDISEEIPDTILINFVQVNVQNGKPVFEITASQGEFFQKKKMAELEAVSFREFDATGTMVTEGFANEGIYFTDSGNAELESGLYFYSSREEASIRSDYLYYNKDEKKISGRPEDSILIETDAGSRIEGQGFQIDLRTREIELARSANGTWVKETGDDE